MASAAAAGLGETALGYVVPGYVVEVFPSCCIEGWTKLVAKRRNGASHMVAGGYLPRAANNLTPAQNCWEVKEFTRQQIQSNK